ncbi:MAG: restriction endonuclease subunit S [Bdellovibrionota bacterium]|jgi:type I restriction enzyme S subunit
MKLAPYSRYSQVGLPWLKQLPEGWELRRAKFVFDAIDIRSETGEEEILTVSSSDGVVPRSQKNVTMFMAESYVGHKLCWAGDLVINSLWAWAKGLGFARQHGLVSSAYGVYRLKKPYQAYENFLHYALRSMAYDWEFRVRSKGIWTSRLQLTDDSFFNIPIILPPPDEQQKIVNFIQQQDRRIRWFIRNKRRLIELLRERRRGVCSKATGKGVNSEAPMIQSDFPWIGEVPAHWKITRVKNEFLCLNNKRVPLSATVRGEMTSRNYDYYGASGVIDKVDDYLFDDELLLVAEDGANLVLRNLPLAIIAKGKFWVNNHAHILKPKDGNLEYLALVLERLNYLPWITGAAQPKLTKDRLLAIPIALPDSREQMLIMDSIKGELEPLDASISQANSELKLMGEYRSRLIADSVTGKIDLRSVSLEAAADEIEEDLTEISENGFEDMPEDEAELEEETAYAN